MPWRVPSQSVSQLCGTRLDARLDGAWPVPVGLGTERGGQKIDEGTRLGRQVTPVRIERVDCDVAVEAIARKQRDERAVLEMAAHVPGGLERNAQAGERPFAQHFPVVADIAAGHSDRV